jgi:condensin complex subunit 1
MEVDGEKEEQSRPSTPNDSQKPASALSQLLFIVGHVAIKQIVHLELCEQDFKRRKAEKEAKTGGSKTPRKSMSVAPSEPPTTANKSKKQSKSKTPAPEEEQDELDLIAGTTEDDFTEAIQHIRERELLYGPTSILSSYGPLVAEICSNNTTYPDSTLQLQAALCMAKLMCVSSEYCESHLSLLITILERSKDATVRSNLVVALGDMAVCFNHLIDENTDFLYRRLNDADVSVKRTCLMTLTFLILAGQVKVKGQLGEMAKCTEDEDRRIRDMSRMFFTELATKDNAVYNHFVDMFSLLSADGKLGEDAFRRIIKFLLGFIEKVCVLFLIFISAGIIGFHRSIVLLMKQLANPT